MKRDITGKFAGSRMSRAWAYFYRMFLFTTGSVFSAALLMAIGGVFFSTHTTDAQIITHTNTIEVEKPAAILARISDCESGGGKAGSAHQFNKDGSVVEHKNSNGTYDIGKFQINSIHLAEAMQLGDNLFTEDGNTAYATYLWTNKGTGDWDSSNRCWRR